MSAKLLLVLSCVVAALAAPNTDTQPQPHSESATQEGEFANENCDEENRIINNFKASHGGVATPNLDGDYKFVIIYDPAYPNDDRNKMCLRTEYKMESQKPDEHGNEVTVKVEAKSIIDVTYVDHVEGEGEHAKVFEKEMQVAEIIEHAERRLKDDGKPEEDGSYWTMYGTMRQINAPKGKQVQPPVSYKGDFNFFYNKGGVVGYSACSVDKKGKGIVLIVSKDNTVTREQLLHEGSTEFNYVVEARAMLEQLAMQLNTLKEESKQLAEKDLDSHIYVTYPMCW